LVLPPSKSTRSRILVLVVDVGMWWQFGHTEDREHWDLGVGHKMVTPTLTALNPLHN